VAFEPLEALRILAEFGHEKTDALVNESPVMPIGVQAGRFPYPDEGALWSLLDEMTGNLFRIAGSDAAKKQGNIQVLNTVMLGALCASGLTGFEAEAFEETIRRELPGRFVDLNLSAFHQGMKLPANGKTA
jgi:Pyruvate/2-oxoacid:ferredoxin oxidoreductase gamma subunit